MAAECESFVSLVIFNDDIMKKLLDNVRKPDEILTYHMWHVRRKDSCS